MTTEEKLDIIRDDVTQIKTVLLGVPNTGDKGLVGFVREEREARIDLNNRHRKLSKSFWLLIGILSGSGVLGGGALGIAKLIA